MRALLLTGVVVGLLALWIGSLRRRLRAAQVRGDMFRDAAVRLDRRAAGLAEQEP